MIKAELIEAIENHVRYDTKDERGQTRRERNTIYDISTPQITVGDDIKHVWFWYSEITQFFVRIKDSVCYPIPPSEFLSWRDLTGEIVHEFEFELLVAMDRAYCRVMNDELKDFNIREHERHKKETEKKTGRRR